LLDEQNRHAARGDAYEQVGDLRDQHRRQPFGRLVHHDQMGIAHQRAADGQHLLLAAGEDAAGIVGALPQRGEHREHVVDRPASGAARVLGAEEQILADGERGEDVAVLGHVPQTLTRDDVRRQAADLLVPEADGAGGLHVAHDGLDRRRAPDAVAAEETHDLALTHAQIDAVEDVTLAVERVEIGHAQHQATPCGTPR
jgi:hypothetical protein